MGYVLTIIRNRNILSILRFRIIFEDKEEDNWKKNRKKDIRNLSVPLKK